MNAPTEMPKVLNIIFHIIALFGEEKKGLFNEKENFHQN